MSFSTTLFNVLKNADVIMVTDREVENFVFDPINNSVELMWFSGENTKFLDQEVLVDKLGSFMVICANGQIKKFTAEMVRSFAYSDVIKGKHVSGYFVPEKKNEAETITPARNLHVVLAKLINGIPSETPIYSKLVGIYVNMGLNVAYTAPECMGGWWEQVAAALNAGILEPFTEEWQVTTIACFTHQSIDEFKRIYKQSLVE